MFRRIFDFTYRFARPLLFALPPEVAHHVTIAALRQIVRWELDGPIHLPDVRQDPVRVMGLNFRNRLGLAAGMDKAGNAVDGFAALGFGFIEVGTVTPVAQPGNPTPRLFRLKGHQALINRMGFNNPGIGQMLENLQGRRFAGPVGINLGKNAVTPIDRASDDYAIGLRRAWCCADYLAVNLSSPNTAGLRSLQSRDAAGKLLDSLNDAREEMRAACPTHNPPIAVKIAPDLHDDDIRSLADLLMEKQMDAVIATNTTVDRSFLGEAKFATEAGGFSGPMLRGRANDVVALLRRHMGRGFPIIGVGGIDGAAAAIERRQAGADLIQIYTSLVYGGPSVVTEVVNALRQNESSDAN